MAALLALRRTPVKPVGAVEFHPLFNELRIREIDPYRDGVRVADRVQKIVCFVGQPVSSVNTSMPRACFEIISSRTMSSSPKLHAKALGPCPVSICLSKEMVS